jgi:ribose transport system permease protein
LTGAASLPSGTWRHHDGLCRPAIIVVGMTAALVSGGFDLSVGSVFAMGGVTAAIALRAELPVGVSIAIGVGAGLLAGLVNGLLITKAKINPFITTLGMMGIARGVGYAITEGSPIGGAGGTRPRLQPETEVEIAQPDLWIT